MTGPSVVWFRDDLRIADNPALAAAAERGEPVVCVYVLDEESRGIRPLGGASRWWLGNSLASLSNGLERIGTPLVLRRGAAARELASVVAETGAGAVFWNRRYGAAERELDASVKSSLRANGVDARSFGANLLFEPWTLQTGQGTPFRVFTPFWAACLAEPEPRHPLPAVDELRRGPALDSDVLEAWELLPSSPDWAGGLRERWNPGESAAQDALARFEREGVEAYAAEHDLPAEDGTSSLSPRLRFGELSPHQLWHGIRHPGKRRSAAGTEGAAAFLRQLGWREFSYHLLFHRPEITSRNMRPEFDAFPWAEPDDETLGAWQRGRTGIPLVDAGMRELWQTGVMHNRVRMVVASFLVKNLLIDWRLGEAWFWDTLVDANPASNAVNWQWVAGSGVDAAPYFRVFNPELQAAKFDPHGQYVARYVPEAGTDAYPEPIVDLAESRRAALEAYATIRDRTRPPGRKDAGDEGDGEQDEDSGPVRTRRF